MKKFLIILMVLFSFCLMSCDDAPIDDIIEPEEDTGGIEMENPIIVITLEDERKITLELYPDIAPISVENFLKLVDEKYYDGVVFHRIIEGFMIQTGGYYIDDMTLCDKPQTPCIKGEFASNGVENNLKHELGVISMARTSDPNSATGQFFICAASTPHLDGNYAVFGKTVDIESEEVVLDISKVDTGNIGYGFTDFPLTPVVIKSIRRG